MPRTVLKTKEDWSINAIGFLVGIVLIYTLPPILDHFLVKNGIIIEAVVTEKHNYGFNPNFHYAYKVDKMEYNGKTVLRKNIFINDTILIIRSAKNMNKSCVVCLQRNQATLSASAKQHIVVVNNLSSDEKKSACREINGRTEETILGEIEKNLYCVKCGHHPPGNSIFR